MGSVSIKYSLMKTHPTKKYFGIRQLSERILNSDKICFMLY